MSASSTPTLSPLAFKPSAKLAATVDLPTPPLPEATATIAPTPGIAPRCGRFAAAAPGRPAPSAGVCGAGCAAVLPRAAVWAVSTAATGLDLDRERDIAVADRDSRDHPERDDIAPAIGVGDSGERLDHLFFSDSHLIPQSGRRPGD